MSELEALRIQVAHQRARLDVLERVVCTFMARENPTRAEAIAIALRLNGGAGFTHDNDLHQARQDAADHVAAPALAQLLDEALRAVRDRPER